MKPLKKVFQILTLLLLLLIGALIAFPFIYAEQIKEKIIEEVNKELNASVSIKEVDLSLFRSFPDLNVKLGDVALVGVNTFDGDTLFYANQVETSLNLKTWWKENSFQLKELEIKDAALHLLVNDSLYNWDITKPSEDTSQVSFSSSFDEIKLHNGSFTYTDSAGKTIVEIEGIESTSNGAYADDVFDLNHRLKADRLLVVYDEIPYLNNFEIAGTATTHIDLLEDKYSFKENDFTLNQLPVKGNGFVQFVENDDMVFDLEFASEESTLAHFMSLIPALYKEDLKGTEISGKANLIGTYKGILSETSSPGYSITSKITQGYLKYQNMPEALENLKVDLNVVSPDGLLDHTVIALNSMSFNLGNEPFMAQLMMKTLESNPFLEGKVDGRVDLGKMKALIQMEELEELSGRLTSNLSFSGYLNALADANVSRFKAIGALDLSQAKLKTRDMPAVFNISTGEFNFTERHLDVEALSLKVGESDLYLKGQLKEIFPYLLSGEKLKGYLSLTSQNLNVADFTSESELEQASTTKEVHPVLLPKNLTFSSDWNIDKLVYDNKTYSRILGSGQLQDGALNINQLSTEAFGGQLSLKGLFKSDRQSGPFTDLKLTVSNLDIAEVFKRVETLRILAPIAKYMNGKFSSTIDVSSFLNPDFSPRLDNLNCSGLVDFVNCKLQGNPVLDELGQRLNNQQLRSTIDINDLLLKFGIQDGKINFNPFDLPIGETMLHMLGNVSLGKTIDFDGVLTVPKQLYEKDIQAYQQYIPKTKWLDLEKTDFDHLNLALEIVGAIAKPQLKINYDGLKKSLKDQIKENITDQVDRRKKEVEDQAKRELEEAKERAALAKKKAEEDARKRLEEEKRKLEEKARQEADAAKKKAEEEVRNRLEDILKKRK
jgi:hypothetical protein